MPKTLSQILTEANAFLDLESAVPTGTELNTRSNLAHQAVWDAAATGQFSEFTEPLDVATPSILTSLFTVALPAGFREFEEKPYIAGDPNDNYEQIKTRDRGRQDDGDKYFYLLGNPAEGYHAIFRNLTLDKTLTMTTQRFPSGLLTLTDVCELPDPQYVVAKIESYVLQSRGDERFPFVDSTANTKLLNMTGREMKTPGGGTNRTKRVQKNPLS